MDDLITRLIDAGTPGHLVAEVARELARAEVAKEALTHRRERDAHRQAAKRERDNVTSRDSADVTAAPALSRPPNENNLTPPPIPTRDNKTTRARGCRLPANWQPEPLEGDLAQRVAAWPVGAIERELARFRDWAASATGPNAVKLDWQAAWRNWVRKADDEGRHNGRPNHDIRRGSAAGTDNRSSLARAIDEGLANLQ